MQYFKTLFCETKNCKKTNGIFTSDGSMLYSVFFATAQNIASQLVLHTNYENEICVILGRKSISLYQSFMACILSNLVYAPINMEAGSIRNSELIKIANPSYMIILDDDIEAVLNLLPSENLKTIFVWSELLYVQLIDLSLSADIVLIRPFCEATHPIFFEAKESDIVYMMFTSGSTGHPKGIPISYSNLHAYLDAIFSLFPFSAEDRVIQLCDIGFDLSIHEILIALICGAGLYVYNVSNEMSLASFIVAHKISHGYFVPSAIPTLSNQAALFRLSLLSLRKIFVCGEAFPLSYAKALQNIAPYASIFNLYGPTEATIACAYHFYRKEIEYASLSSVPIGFPFPGTGFKLTHANEIIISGKQVYKNFCSNENGESKYPTGDVASFHSDFGYIFHGRKDDQWKIKGFRIEKNDVEERLRLFFGDPKLYIVPIYDALGLVERLFLFGLHKIDIHLYRNQLSMLLPEQAIPAKSIQLKMIPALPNGKVNYRFLSQCALSLGNYQFYLEHSLYSDPGEMGFYFGNLPFNLQNLIESVNEWYIHYNDIARYQLKIPLNRYRELDLRYVRLALLMLAQQSMRPILGICRDTALMICSIFRSRGVPARLRAGFNTYYSKTQYVDGFCLEFFDVDLLKWRLVDTRTTQSVINHLELNITFDLTDLQSDQFISAGTAWKGCRLGLYDPNIFGSGLYHGIDYVRTKVIQDFLLLNKQELLIWDLWDVFFDVNLFDYAAVDELADYIEKNSSDVEKIQLFYKSYPQLHPPKKRVVCNPFLVDRSEEIESL